MSDINQKISFKKNKNYICRELPEGHAIYSFSFSNFIGGLNVFLVTFKNQFSLITREIQIKTTDLYHLTLVRMAIIKKSTNEKAGVGVKKREPLYTVMRM